MYTPHRLFDPQSLSLHIYPINLKDATLFENHRPSSEGGGVEGENCILVCDKTEPSVLNRIYSRPISP